MKQAKSTEKTKLQTSTESVKSQLFQKTAKKLIQENIELLKELAKC